MENPDLVNDSRGSGFYKVTEANGQQNLNVHVVHTVMELAVIIHEFRLV